MILKKKVIQLKLEIVSGNPNCIELCEALTQIVLNSTFGSTAFNGDVIECKIIKDEEIKQQQLETNKV